MDDQTLLSQYVATQDATAFEELTSRYSGLVRGVCLRLLGNSHDAEEVTQECFFELSRQAGCVHTSLGGWLRQTATSRSLNALRSRARRKVRERVVGLDVGSVAPAIDLTTPDLHRLIQRALTELPDDLRLPMVLHYVDGRSQRDVAVQLGVNQSTISRRMRDALRQMRDKLTQAGYAATAPAMVVWMQEHAAAANCETLLTDVAVSAAAGKVAGGTSLTSLLKGTATAFLPVLGFLVFNGWASLLIAFSVMMYVARYRPTWVCEVMSSFGLSDPYRQPTFFLSRWDWTTPPNGWQTQATTALVWSVLLIGLALTFAFGTPQPPWGTVALGLAIAIVCFVHAVRLLCRARRVDGNRFRGRIALQRENAPAVTHPANLPMDEPIWTWFDVVQLISIGLAGVGIPAQLVLQPQTHPVWPAVILGATIGTVMLIFGIRLCHRLVFQPRRCHDIHEIRGENATASGGTLTIIVIGAVIVSTLSIGILWNPGAVRSLSLSLAAVQTLMIGWIVYRIAAIRLSTAPRVWSRLIIALLIGCFVLNSGMCLAHWMH